MTLCLLWCYFPWNGSLLQRLDDSTWSVEVIHEQTAKARYSGP